MTHGVIGGMLITDLVSGKDNPWGTIYDPSRKTLRSLGEYAKENLNVAKQYSDWLQRGDVASIADIPRGHGAILRRGLKMHAVYVNDAGVAHEYSAVCPHLGGVVRWNTAEKTWDCPCHGSRFYSDGRLLHGPANKDLAPVKDSEPKTEVPSA
jgi:Rieske Fe-S protein